jgi:hypothetical protein
MHPFRAPFALLFSCAACLMACSGGSDPDTPPGGTSSGGTSSGGTSSGGTSSGGEKEDDTATSTEPSTPAGPTCKTPDDCPYWYCECSSGPPVNTRHCTNGVCEDAATACPDSCAAFGETWTGSAGGGF